jgi:hypothetical protein
MPASFNQGAAKRKSNDRQAILFYQLEAVSLPENL